MRFTVPVTLLQPSVAEGAAPTEHVVMGRRLTTSGFRGVVDGAVAAGGSETWQVDNPPAGLGTRWSARIDDVPYSVDSAVRDHEMLPVWTLVLNSTARTGELAVPG